QQLPNPLVGIVQAMPRFLSIDHLVNHFAGRASLVPSQLGRCSGTTRTFRSRYRRNAQPAALPVHPGPLSSFPSPAVALQIGATGSWAFLRYRALFVSA